MAPWLARQLELAHKKVESWPDWKKAEAKRWAEETAKPYPKNRLNYPIVGGGFIV